MAGPLLPFAVKALGKGVAAKVCTAKTCEAGVAIAATGIAAYVEKEMDNTDFDDGTYVPIDEG